MKYNPNDAGDVSSFSREVKVVHDSIVDEFDRKRVPVEVGMSALSLITARMVLTANDEDVEDSLEVLHDMFCHIYDNVFCVE